MIPAENGDFAALVKASDGTLVANYDYGPFGEVIRQTGPMAKANPFRFSTKYQDDECDLFYYGYRYYKPSTGTWVSRDPLEEQGFELIHTLKPSIANGLNLYQCPSCKRSAATRVKMAANEPNLYGFVQNAPIEQVDALGLFATLDSSGCKDHANDINNAWQRATAAIQKAIDNNNEPAGLEGVFDSISHDKGKVPVKCGGCYGDIGCYMTGAPAVIGLSTVHLCQRAFSSSCLLAATLAVEVSKVDCGVTAAGQEILFSKWLTDNLCKQ